MCEDSCGLVISLVFACKAGIKSVVIKNLVLCPLPSSSRSVKAQEESF